MNSKTTLKQKVMNEMYLFFIYFLFMDLFFCSLTTYRRLLLSEYFIDYLPYGYAFIESMIMAKIVLIGRHLKWSNKFAEKPLIIPVIYKTIIFTILAMLFTILEHFATGFLHGLDYETIYQKFMHYGIDQILAQILITAFVFSLFFAFTEIDRVLGEGQLIHLFFKSSK